MKYKTVIYIHRNYTIREEERADVMYDIVGL